MAQQERESPDSYPSDRQPGYIEDWERAILQELGMGQDGYLTVFKRVARETKGFIKRKTRYISAMAGCSACGRHEWKVGEETSEPHSRPMVIRDSVLFYNYPNTGLYSYTMRALQQVFPSAAANSYDESVLLLRMHVNDLVSIDPKGESIQASRYTVIDVFGRYDWVFGTGDRRVAELKYRLESPVVTSRVPQLGRAGNWSDVLGILSGAGR